MHICMDEVNLFIAAVREVMFAIPLIRMKMGL
jgi:hypothetical protein